MNLIHVLIADDHHVMRLGIRALLERCSNIQVVGEASNGLEAVQKVKELNPDLLILDMQMPVMDGYEAAQQLRAEGNPVKIIILSAYNDKHMIKAFYDLGVSKYMVKDEAPKTLIDTVVEVGNS